MNEELKLEYAERITSVLERISTSLETISHLLADCTGETDSGATVLRTQNRS